MLAMGRCFAAPPTIPLKATVEVTTGTVCLGDLLPQDITPDVPDLARNIELGHSPQPGNSRVIAGRQIEDAMAGTPLRGRVEVPRQVLVQRTGWSVSSEMVLGTLKRTLAGQGRSAAGLPDAALWQWPMPVVAAAQDPVLELRGMKWDRRTSALEVRMRCAEVSACGSFLVRAPMSRPDFDAVASSSFPLQAPAHLARSQSRARATAGPVLAQAGRPATLLLEGDGMRIKLQVVCLDRGRLGQTVRARDSVGRKVYVAEVAGPGLLTAAF